MIGVSYDQSGRILWSFDVPVSDFEKQEGLLAVGKGNPHDDYVDFSGPTPQILPRQDVALNVNKSDIIADLTDFAVITNLPDPCHLFNNGDVVEIVGGSYIFATDKAGLFRLELIGKYRGKIEITAHDLSTLRAKTKSAIDAAAESARLKYITPGSGQSMVYEQKNKEAQAVTIVISNGGSIVPGDYPILNAEATATNSTVENVAAVVTTTAAQWVTLAANIEGLRMAAKAAVDVAATPADVLAAAEVVWP